jgi:hypothetical protein
MTPPVDIGAVYWGVIETCRALATPAIAYAGYKIAKSNYDLQRQKRNDDLFKQRLVLFDVLSDPLAAFLEQYRTSRPQSMVLFRHALDSKGRSLGDDITNELLEFSIKICLAWQDGEREDNFFSGDESLLEERSADISRGVQLEMDFFSRWISRRMNFLFEFEHEVSLPVMGQSTLPTAADFDKLMREIEEFADNDVVRSNMKVAI